MGMGELESASQSYREAHKRRPDDIGIRYNLALALIELHHFDEVRPHLEHGLHMTPGSQELGELASRIDTPQPACKDTTITC